MTLEELRAERNRRLAETDYLFTPDVNVGNKNQNGYILSYRQQLRDLPENPDLDLDNVVWPVKPVEWM